MTEMRTLDRTHSIGRLGRTLGLSVAVEPKKQELMQKLWLATGDPAGSAELERLRSTNCGSAATGTTIKVYTK
jgi:hypothetical protein